MSGSGRTVRMAIPGGNGSVQNQYCKANALPAPIVFPIVWSILYILMGISAAKVTLASSSRQRSVGLNLFITQLAVNFLWSPIFFRFQAFGFAFFWILLLWILVCAMILVFGSVVPAAGKLQVPYLLWLSFAAYLNFGVWFYNH